MCIRCVCVGKVIVEKYKRIFTKLINFLSPFVVVIWLCGFRNSLFVFDDNKKCVVLFVESSSE